MATVTFYTRTNLDKLAPVYLRLTDTGGVNLIVRTPFKMIPSYWNVKKQKCTDDIADSDVFSRNDAFKVEDEFHKLKKHLLKAYFDLRVPVTAAWITGEINKYFYKDAPPSKAETLRQYIGRFYDEAQAGIRLATVKDTKRPYAYETLRSIRGTKLSFEMFVDETHRKSNFVDINIDWYNDFLNFYYKRGCTANYIGRHIKTLKTILRAARDEGKRIHLFVDETRPVLQGARLTAWEMMRENIPATLITDNMAGFVMKQGKINLVIVGADRIAANGDAANKIGTYSLAVLAKVHGIPFYIAAPLSTIDRTISNGDGIPIEERDHGEVVCFRGVQTAPEDMPVYNPAFDVTPHEYITAIITEAGLAVPPCEKSIENLFRSQK